MILNLIVIAFVLGMAVMWATYGLFSALLHLLVVIVSGALAFAFWELWVYKLFMGFAPLYAWSVGLVVPFAVLVIVIRVGLDKFVKGNMQFPRLADQIVGGALGACSGILTAGVALIGIGFLPMPPAIAGWQPYEVQSDGAVIPRDGGKLWISVDTMAANFFSKLSVGAFKPGSNTPLAGYLPNVDKQAGVSRLGKTYDPNISVVATPGTVKATAASTFSGEEIPEVDAVINDFITGKLKTTGTPGLGKLVTVQTEWTKGDGGSTYGTDNVLRLPPTQIRLHVIADDGSGALLPPIGFAKKDANGNAEFYRVIDNQIMASSLFDPDQITWFFAAPGTAKPNVLLARYTRVDLPTPADEGDGGALAAQIGSLYDPSNTAATQAPTNTTPKGENAVTAEPDGYTTHKAYAIEQSNSLPNKVSKNKAQAFGYDGNEINSGSGILGKGTSGGDNNVDAFSLSAAMRPVRLQIGPHSPPPGGTPVGNQQEVYLTDGRGSTYYPYAYALTMSDGRQKAGIELTKEYRYNTDLPINEIRGDEKLFIYFRVPPGVTIESYHIGPTTQAIGFQVGG